MRKLLFAIITSLFIAGSFTVYDATAQEKPLTIVFFDDFAPFSFIQDGKITGILHDSLEEVLFNRMKIKVEFKAGPWARMQELVKSGEADAFCTTPTEARKEYSVPSTVPTLLPIFKIYTHASNKNLAIIKTIINLDDLKKAGQAKMFTIGTYIGDGWAKANLEASNITIDYTPSLEQTILKVATQRVDTIVNLDIVQQYSMKKLRDKLTAQGNADQTKQVSEIIELGPTMDQGRFHFAISKKSPYLKILGEFETVMKQATKDGSIEKIIKKYQ